LDFNKNIRQGTNNFAAEDQEDTGGGAGGPIAACRGRGVGVAACPGILQRECFGGGTSALCPQKQGLEGGPRPSEKGGGRCRGAGKLRPLRYHFICSIPMSFCGT